MIRGKPGRTMRAKNLCVATSLAAIAASESHTQRTGNEFGISATTSVFRIPRGTGSKIYVSRTKMQNPILRELEDEEEKKKTGEEARRNEIRKKKKIEVV